MKKVIIILSILSISLISCKKESSNPKDIKNQILNYKTQISDINKKIDDLYKKLGEDTTTVANDLKVNVIEIKKTAFEHFVDITGNVDAVNNALISPQMNGQIVKIYVKEGQQVRRGQVLAKLNDDVLNKNLAQLQTSLLLADTMYQKQKKLYDQNVVSEVQYLQSKNQKESLEKNIDVIKSQIALSIIRAPFSGIIDQIFVKEGEMTMPGKPVIQIVNLSKMEVTADVPENYLPTVNVNNKINLTFQTYPDIKITSKISFKGNVIDPVNRTFRLKAIFANIGNKIKPNMLAVLHFNDFSTKSAIVVPTQILSKDISGWYLFIVNKENDKYIANKKYVKIGISDLKNTIINSGLNEGELVVTKGFNLVKDGAIVNIDK